MGHTHEERIRMKQRNAKIAAMKCPVIIMNDLDFRDFVKELESKVTNYKVGNSPTFGGISIKPSSIMDRNQIIIYDHAIIAAHDWFIRFDDLEDCIKTITKKVSG